MYSNVSFEQFLAALLTSDEGARCLIIRSFIWIIAIVNIRGYVFIFILQLVMPHEMVSARTAADLYKPGDRVFVRSSPESHRFNGLVYVYLKKEPEDPVMSQAMRVETFLGDFVPAHRWPFFFWFLPFYFFVASLRWSWKYPTHSSYLDVHSFCSLFFTEQIKDEGGKIGQKLINGKWQVETAVSKIQKTTTCMWCRKTREGKKTHWFKSLYFSLPVKFVKIKIICMFFCKVQLWKPSFSVETAGFDPWKPE